MRDGEIVGSEDEMEDAIGSEKRKEERESILRLLTSLHHSLTKSCTPFVPLQFASLYNICVQAQFRRESFQLLCSSSFSFSTAQQSRHPPPSFLLSPFVLPHPFAYPLLSVRILFLSFLIFANPMTFVWDRSSSIFSNVSTSIHTSLISLLFQSSLFYFLFKSVFLFIEFSSKINRQLETKRGLCPFETFFFFFVFLLSYKQLSRRSRSVVCPTAVLHSNTTTVLFLSSPPLANS